MITPSEKDNIEAAVASYNGFISSEASARGMAYLDLNPALADVAATGAIPPIPNFTPALGGQPVSFGAYFSLDGVHPSTLAHEMVAGLLAEAVNDKFGTTIPTN